MYNTNVSVYCTPESLAYFYICLSMCTVCKYDEKWPNLSIVTMIIQYCAGVGLVGNFFTKSMPSVLYDLRISPKHIYPDGLSWFSWKQSTKILNYFYQFKHWLLYIYTCYKWLMPQKTYSTRSPLQLNLSFFWLWIPFF